MEVLAYFTPSLQEILVFMAIGHRMVQSGDRADSQALSVLGTRMYDHRGKAIQAVNKVLSMEKVRGTDYALLTVLMLLFGEVSMSHPRAKPNTLPTIDGWPYRSVHAHRAFLDICSCGNQSRLCGRTISKAPAK